MFPNPQDALPLSTHPNAEQFRKLAKDLVNACREQGADGIRAWSSAYVGDLVERGATQQSAELLAQTSRWSEQVAGFASKTLLQGDRLCSLARAQFVMARAHGFASWPRLMKHIQGMERRTSAVSTFEQAADAVVAGDLRRLEELVAGDPALVRQVSTRDHRATLLHYTAANGVEQSRQVTPHNVVAIARFLLESGAEVDAEADVYGGGCTTLGLAATSGHPEKAGVQEALLQLLLDHGARLEKPGLAGNTHGAVVACLANGRPQAAAFLAARGASLDLEGAAGTGRLEAVRACFRDDRTLQPPATHRELQAGFLWACMYGHEDVASFLLEHGADLRDAGGTGATGLHWVAGGGHVRLAQRLLALGAPLEVLNQWGGTVLEQAGYGFAHANGNVDFTPMFEMLLAAGAEIRGYWLAWLSGVQSRSAADRARAADVFQRYGATR